MPRFDINKYDDYDDDFQDGERKGKNQRKFKDKDRYTVKVKTRRRKEDEFDKIWKDDEADK